MVQSMEKIQNLGLVRKGAQKSFDQSPKTP